MNVQICKLNVSVLSTETSKGSMQDCKHMCDAVRLVANVIFTKEELLQCSVGGRHTNKGVEKRPALVALRLKFLISKNQISI